MKILIIIFLIIFLILGVLSYLKKKYNSPYSVSLYFGERRCGKSADIIKQTLRYHKDGWNIFYTDKELYDSLIDELSYVKYIPLQQLGKILLPRYSVVFCDEVGLWAHKRGFADKEQQAIIKPFRDFLKLSGHCGVTVVMYSQCVDIDRSLIESSDSLYMLKKYLSIFTVVRKIKKEVILSKDADSQGVLVDDLSFIPAFMLSKSWTVNLIPKYIRYYNSFYLPNLPTWSMFLKSVKNPSFYDKEYVTSSSSKNDDVDNILE